MKFSIFIIFLLSIYFGQGQNHILGIYSGANASKITGNIDIVNTNYLFSPHLGINYKVHVNSKFFLNANVGTIVKGGQTDNSIKITNNDNQVLPPLGIESVGRFRYLHLAILFGVKRYLNFQENNYAYVNTGFAPDILLSSTVEYNANNIILEKTTYNILNTKRIDLNLFSQIGFNSKITNKLALDLSFQIFSSLFPIYKKYSYPVNNRTPFHFGGGLTAELQYQL